MEAKTLKENNTGLHSKPEFMKTLDQHKINGSVSIVGASLSSTIIPISNTWMKCGIIEFRAFHIRQHQLPFWEMMVVGKEIHFFFPCFEVATLSVLPVHEKGPGTVREGLKCKWLSPWRETVSWWWRCQWGRGGRMIVAPLTCLSKSLFMLFFFPIKEWGPPLLWLSFPPFCQRTGTLPSFVLFFPCT